MEREIVIDVNNVTVQFNLASEKIDNIKEYVVKFLKRQLLFQEFYALKNVSLILGKGERWEMDAQKVAGRKPL